MIARLAELLGVVVALVYLLRQIAQWVRTRKRGRPPMLLLLMLIFVPATCFAQNHFPLEVVHPLASGAVGTGLHASNRIYRAYQGIEYTIKADAIGGRWPYTYSLSDQPSGMTIEAGPCTTVGPSCTAGTITWPDPQATDSSITVQICDADNDCANATWGVTVSTTIGADGFCFINADSGNDTTGNGSLATPWQTYGKANTSCGARSILYFRGATASYDFSGITPTAQAECGVNGKVRIVESTGPVIFIGYPGESPVFDMDTGYTALAPCFEVYGAMTWFSNMTFRDCYRKCFEIQRNGNYGITFWKNTVNGQGPGQDSDNSAVIMFSFLGTGVQAYFDFLENNTVSNVVQGTANSCFKQYSARKSTIAYNSFTTIAADECVAPKMAVSQYTIRGNVFQGITGSAIWGNQMDGNDSGTRTYGEILFNNVKDSTDDALQLNQHATAAETFIYRNTIVGTVRVWNAATTNGPFNFTDNVIINSTAASGSCPAKIICYQVTDYTKIVLSSNLTGVTADNIVNAAGELQGSYRTSYLGLDGWELGGGSVSMAGVIQRVVFFAEGAGGVLVLVHLLSGAMGVWSLLGRKSQAAMRVWRYTVEAGSQWYWTVRYTRACRKWQAAAPKMLPPPSDTVQTTVEHRDRARL